MSMASASDLNIPSPQLTSLECLHLKGQFDWNNVDTNYSSPLFIHTPQLSELRLFDTGFIMEFQLLPLEQIRMLWLQQYEVPGGTAMHMVSISEHFPHLEMLVLYDMLVVESIDAMTRDGIQTLQLRSPEGLSDIFDMMMLPDLRCLEIIDDDMGSSRKTLVITTLDVDAMLPFVASSPVLTEIRLSNLAIHNKGLLGILEETPELKRLAIVEYELLERLKEPSMFLTKLEHVELVWAKNDEIEEGKILDVLEAQHSCGVVIGMRGGKELKEETLTKIQSLRAREMVGSQGLDVYTHIYWCRRWRSPGEGYVGQDPGPARAYTEVAQPMILESAILVDVYELSEIPRRMISSFDYWLLCSYWLYSVNPAGEPTSTFSGDGQRQYKNSWDFGCAAIYPR
ncbi:hypothetical protein EV421DRAFT_1977803 [Armillaria borealis]|uniref:Uncharacterized protein n=1 Tax=Armillaria borealis TaxID=47425 RepID=A0AA39J829_9AGAR|nr:hypothetical protein EV421DRAFT_1977803 [Armillaria borealis]